MTNLGALMQRAADYLKSLSPVDRALMDDQQRRSWVIGETGRDPGPNVLASEVLRLRRELEWRRGDTLDAKETERLERLKRRAYHLQNQIDAKPVAYNMDRSKAELSALCWAIEKITGKPFDPASLPQSSGPSQEKP